MQLRRAEVVHLVEANLHRDKVCNTHLLHSQPSSRRFGRAVLWHKRDIRVAKLSLLTG